MTGQEWVQTKIQAIANRFPRFIDDETHHRFVASFKELYAVNGMKGLSAAELSSKTGYSRSTFYRYFDSVYDLLDMLEIEATPYANMSYLVDHADEVGMVEITEAFLGFCEEKQQLIRILTRHQDDNHYYSRMRECLKPAFKSQAERVYIMEPSEYDAMAEYLTESKLSLLRTWALGNTDLNLGQLTKVTDAVLEGGFWDRVQGAAEAKRIGAPYHRIPLSYFVSIHPWLANRPLCS
jgi:AcrR family transcriptional regulator